MNPPTQMPHVASDNRHVTLDNRPRMVSYKWATMFELNLIARGAVFMEQTLWQ
jgi:hypothetical protein